MISQQIDNKVKNDFYIVITEYPKSGGTWLTSLIGDILDVPKRELYYILKNINNVFKFDVLKHPWYKDTKSTMLEPPCVIKSHELPRSTLINFNPKYIHLLRDGRDIVISKYFYEKDFCVENGIYKKFDISFDDYLKKVALEWRIYINAWLQEKIPYFKYEDLLIRPKETLMHVLNSLQLDYSDQKVDIAIAKNTKNKFGRQYWGDLIKHNTFVRKGIMGDWKNYFTIEHSHIFKDIAGDILIKLGYEKNYRW